MQFKKENKKVQVEVVGDRICYVLEGLKVTEALPEGITALELQQHVNLFLNNSGYEGFKIEKPATMSDLKEGEEVVTPKRKPALKKEK